MTAVPAASSSVGEESSSSTEKALLALRAREEELEAELSRVNAAVDQAESGAHGVVRCDPLRLASDDNDEQVKEVLRARAQARIGELAAALGGGRVTLSQPFPLPPRQANGAYAPPPPSCTCRRTAWAVQLYAKERRVQVAAVRLSGLPPDGLRSQLIDLTWFDAVGGSDGVHHGLPRLAVLAASVDAPCEQYEYAVDGLASQLRRLELPPLDYCHLRAQPLLRGGAGECLQLSRALAAIGAELCAWARLDDPLPPNDGAADALHLAMLDPPPSPPPPQDAANLVSWKPPPPGARKAQSALLDGSSASPWRKEDALSAPAARADLAVRWWSRLHLYVGSALLGHAELGLRRWLDEANASLRASSTQHVSGGLLGGGGGGGGLLSGGTAADDELFDAPNGAALALRISSHPHADAERQRRARALIDSLIQGAPAPVGAQLADLVEARARAAAAAAATAGAAGAGTTAEVELR